MKKRGVLISLLIIFLSIILINTALSEEQKVKDAYAWMQGQIFDANSVPLTSQPSENLSFALMTFFYNDTLKNNLIGGGGYPSNSGLLDRKSTLGCWCPNPGMTCTSCDILTTSKAIIALKSIGNTDTTSAENWLISQKKASTSGATWYFQIDQASLYDTTNCTAYYDWVEDDPFTGKFENITVRKDQSYTFGEQTGDCLKLDDKFHILIDSGCYQKTFKVYCNKRSYVSLPFKVGADLWYIPSTPEEAKINPVTPAEVKIKVYCITKGNSCQSTDAYKTTLWAAYALKLAGRTSEVEQLIPYLVSPPQVELSSEETNMKNALLYLSDVPAPTGTNYATLLLKSQGKFGFWKTSSGAIDYFNTGLAAFALSESYRNTNNITLIVENFTTSWTPKWGVGSTSLMLYSFFPRRFLSLCEKAGMECASSAPSEYHILNSTSCSPAGGSCWQLGSCYYADGICNNTEMDSNYAYKADLKCASGYRCYLGNDCITIGGFECKQSCNPITEFVNQNKQINASCSTGFKCCQQVGCAANGLECKKPCDAKTEMVNLTWNGTCGQSYSCCMPNTCVSNDLTCKSSCSPQTEMISTEFSTCGVGYSCCMNNTCYQNNGRCINVSLKKPVVLPLPYEIKDLRYTCLQGGFECYQKNICPSNLRCANTTNPPDFRFESVNSSYRCEEDEDGYVGACTLNNSCSLNGGICKSQGQADEFEDTALTSSCQPGFNLKCFKKGACGQNGFSCKSSCNPAIEIVNLDYNTTCNKGYSCCMPNNCVESNNTCKTSCDPALETVEPTKTCGASNYKCCTPNSCGQNAMRCKQACDSAIEVSTTEYSCGISAQGVQYSCCKNNTCYSGGGMCKLPANIMPYEVIDSDLTCLGDYKCYKKTPCDNTTQVCRSTCDPETEIDNSIQFCSGGKCCKKTECFSQGGICKVNATNNIDEIENSALTSSCQTGRTCYVKSPCVIGQGASDRRCSLSCNLNTESENSGLKCGKGVCCQNTTCALLGGVCKASGELNEVKNETLSQSCQTGRSCWQKSPCAQRNLTCSEDRCPTGTIEKVSALYPDKYKCNTGAVCCEKDNPTISCSFECKSGECKSPFIEVGNTLCVGGGSCCRLDDTCTLNKGYSCSAQCSDSELKVTALTCPYASGVCCRPNYQCLSANNTCRSGNTSSSCLSGEKSVNLGCPEGNVCCEKLPTNVCEDVYQFKCKPTCASTEEKVNYLCPSGICCKDKTVAIACQTLDDCYNKEECAGKTVSDLILGTSGKCEYGKETSCRDNFDNDGDGFIDQEDPDCPKTCTYQGYVCCDACEPGYSKEYYDSSCSLKKCCERCKTAAGTGTTQTPTQKSNNLLWIILGVAVVGIGAAVYFLLHKPKKKSALSGLPSASIFKPGVRPYMPPVSQRPIMRPFQTSPNVQIRQPELRPKLTKTEEDLEETLKKLKKMTEK
jgi:hypothetical protein